MSRKLYVARSTRIAARKLGEEMLVMSGQGSTLFTLNPTATVDEGNNWINMYYGPLSSVNSVTARGAAGYNVPLGDYTHSAGPGGAEGAIPW